MGLYPAVRRTPPKRNAVLHRMPHWPTCEKLSHSVQLSSNMVYSHTPTSNSPISEVSHTAMMFANSTTHSPRTFHDLESIEVCVWEILTSLLQLPRTPISAGLRGPPKMNLSRWIVLNTRDMANHPQ